MFFGFFLNQIKWKLLLFGETDFLYCFEAILFEPRRGKIGFLHMRKQRRRSASR